MHNNILKQDLKTITPRKKSLTITKGDMSDNSIDIFDETKNEDFGNYLYYQDKNKRDEDYDMLIHILY